MFRGCLPSLSVRYAPRIFSLSLDLIAGCRRIAVAELHRTGMKTAYIAEKRLVLNQQVSTEPRNVSKRLEGLKTAFENVVQRHRLLRKPLRRFCQVQRNA
ncbi:hypothetical protein KIN20_001928 [Parelaphostrongylus tenuis]|uniref:Uncharacterized protein n=1 Tax=Parelaphostrongylus tenuis TaxID=148309 RepID=A0AAD5LUY0_PARTN|nr:hypothetical protein KIN20_001928 [Parelaphostrongylus tenuis]